MLILIRLVRNGNLPVIELLIPPRTNSPQRFLLKPFLEFDVIFGPKVCSAKPPVSIVIALKMSVWMDRKAERDLSVSQAFAKTSSIPREAVLLMLITNNASRRGNPVRPILFTTPVLKAVMLLTVVFFSQGAAAQGKIPDLLIEYPDLIVHNAKIITVDDHDYNSNPGTIAQAMATRDGVILDLGSNKEILALKGPDTQIIDLDGRTVLPGIVNNHHHPQGSTERIAREMFELPGALVGFYINLVVAPTADETMAKIAQAVGMLRDRVQVRQTDWLGIELLPDGDAFPDLGSVSFMMSAPAESDVRIDTQALSEIVPENPAVLMSGSNIHIGDKPAGVWYRVTQAENGDPVIEELFTFEF